LTQVSVTAAAAGLTASAQSAAQRVESAFGALDGSPALQGSAFGTAAGALQWTGGGSEGLAASLQSLSGQAHARAESATFDSIDMSRRAIAER
ncbi:autotransporter domain-containing protein, partial [bacterium M00.F.Ca.ET.156.01.1.1]